MKLTERIKVMFADAAASAKAAYKTLLEKNKQLEEEVSVLQEENLKLKEKVLRVDSIFMAKDRRIQRLQEFCYEKSQAVNSMTNQIIELEKELCQEKKENAMLRKMLQRSGTLET